VTENSQPDWSNTFNTGLAPPSPTANLKWAVKTAAKANYPYVCFNRWVFEADIDTVDGDPVCHVEALGPLKSGVAQDLDLLHYLRDFFEQLDHADGLDDGLQSSMNYLGGVVDTLLAVIHDDHPEEDLGEDPE